MSQNQERGQTYHAGTPNTASCLGIATEGRRLSGWCTWWRWSCRVRGQMVTTGQHNPALPGEERRKGCCCLKSRKRATYLAAVVKTAFGCGIVTEGRKLSGWCTWWWRWSCRVGGQMVTKRQHNPALTVKGEERRGGCCCPKIKKEGNVPCRHSNSRRWLRHCHCRQHPEWVLAGGGGGGFVG